MHNGLPNLKLTFETLILQHTVLRSCQCIMKFERFRLEMFWLGCPSQVVVNTVAVSQSTVDDWGLLLTVATVNTYRLTKPLSLLSSAEVQLTSQQW